jgi:hypothetical protein
MEMTLETSETNEQRNKRLMSTLRHAAYVSTARKEQQMLHSMRWRLWNHKRRFGYPNLADTARIMYRRVVRPVSLELLLLRLECEGL